MSSFFWLTVFFLGIDIKGIEEKNYGAIFLVEITKDSHLASILLKNMNFFIVFKKF